MTESTEPNSEQLKQSIELTLIITFIGLAFGLVGLLVRTAEVMGIVVISIGVIVGYVSYHDAFKTHSPSQTPVSTPMTQSLPPPFQEAKSEPEPAREHLPQLPKIKRLPSAQEVIVPIKTTIPLKTPLPKDETQLKTSKKSPAADQTQKTKPQRPRTRKIVEVPQISEKKKE